MYGSHCLKNWSSTQTTLTLSTAEAGLHGIAKGIQVALGFKSMCADINLHKPLRIHSDATAAIGIARRRGLGKLRHLDVEDLWVQDIELNCGHTLNETAKLFIRYLVNQNSFNK